MNIAAFDLSLTSTGFALFDEQLSIGTLTPEKHKTGLARLDWIMRAVLAHCAGADLILFEGLAFGANDPSAQERAGLAYLIRHDLWYDGRPYILVAPTQLKKFVCGKGTAKKEEILRETWKRWNVDAKDNNQADAAVLAYIGKALVGEYQPETQGQREVVGKLKPTFAAELELARGVAHAV